MSAQCQACDRWFVHAVAAMQHMTAVGHWQTYYDCQSCNNRYMYSHHQVQHMNDESHWAPQYDCEGCSAAFWTQQDARKHMDASNHWRKHWCAPCQRGFQNANNLDQHLKGSAHKGGSISCPFCKRPHTTASGVVHHLESNACPSAPRLNRQTIYDMVNRADTRGAITNKQLTWHPVQNGENIATAASWNGRQFECYICHKGYNALRSLDQHLSSPAHKQKIYHCFGTGCGKQFSALAQLFNHLESESCGATRFNAVQQNAKAILGGQRMLAF